MRPSHVFAAILMATSLAAVAVPAYAVDSPLPTGVPTDLPTGLPGDTPTDTPTPSDSASATPSDTATPTPTPSASASTTSGNPVTDLAACLQAAGLNPTAGQKCFTDAAAGLQNAIPGAGGGGSTGPAAAVQAFLACAQTALTSQSAAAGEKCGTTLFGALGIAQATCLDPTLQPLLQAVDKLLGGDPSGLQTELTNLPNTLPAQLQQLPACLQGATPSADPTPSASPTAAASTGTTANSGGATAADPIAAIPVVATPNFTG